MSRIEKYFVLPILLDLLDLCDGVGRFAVCAGIEFTQLFQDFVHGVILRNAV
jgi:hypothetical protein